MIMPTHIVAVAGIVENDKDEILLVKDRRHEMWTLPGGQVEVGENLMEALIREIREESGVTATVHKLVGISSNTGTYEGYNGVKVIPTKIMFEFVCTYVGGELCTSEETCEVGWVPKDQVLEYITEQHLRDRYEAYVNFDGAIQYLAYTTRPEYDLSLKRYI